MRSIYILSNSLRSAGQKLLGVERFAFSAAESRFPLRNLSFCRSIATKIPEKQGNDDSTVSYLINSCGLSPEIALGVSEKVKLRSLEKADSVLALLRNHEFSGTDISKLVKTHPFILVADAEKTLLPKLEFFCSTGISRKDLARTLSNDPTLLKISLKNQIIPSYNFLKSLVLSDKKFIHILKHKRWIFRQTSAKRLLPNVEVLRELGMHQSSIALLLAIAPNILMKNHELFNEIVGQVRDLGFDPMKSSFVSAMRVLAGANSIWRRNQEAYRKWGWTEDEIVSAFKSCPLCMTKSDKKITDTMEFLVNKMGWRPSAIAKCPTVMGLSLKKRIIPRCLVYKILVVKGLEDQNLSLGTLVLRAEKLFLDRFVTRYLHQLPHLSNVYQGKVNIQHIYDQ